ncbi:MAG: sulfide/dihydroorotate dehydrogenase-like FAD/NAD-binding protein [Planctomycetota bacterium]|nr:sulfide/dihydroorotate dehydrogenase-like FAD/NAD-binding protein [Planctomycetota bacterium]MCX8039261.1 sulfide/dihydroorotate dehydrogenase-like FAD/NAD-binding protein [Planctomycetota bacterium]MDW8372629.1 sulfide/dihydroorotate dehydrogenase-like FAD/NAD-binding protein [Planctomycetota bacterium]
MHRVVSNQELAPAVHRLVVEAPAIARARRPGQFVIVRLDHGHERIPLTIADADPAAGTITLVVQAVGFSTRAIVATPPGGWIRDIAGPLGSPTHLIAQGFAVCVGGGVGTAVVHPIAEALHRAGVRLCSIIGGRSRPYVIYHEELARLGEVRVCTDDGSWGRPGLVTDELRALCAERRPDIVYAVGPVPMMQAVVAVTRPLAIPTIVSLNPVMVDGTGMCGGCRVTVGGEVRFACVDGPEFDGFLVDFTELRQRLATYRAFERAACAEEECRARAAGAPARNQP